jgi:small-conductance mechanosensitive channel
MIEAFVDKPEKTLWYQMAFSKFNYNGIETMKWHWSWWAFFGGFFFLLYRKQYMPALILFIASIVLSMIPFGGLLVMILSGGFSTYFVYKGYRQKKLEIEVTIDDEAERFATMRYVGGYNQWVVWVYIVFTAISMALMAFGVIAASMMPEIA